MPGSNVSHVLFLREFKGMPKWTWTYCCPDGSDEPCHDGPTKTYPRLTDQFTLFQVNVGQPNHRVKQEMAVEESAYAAADRSQTESLYPYQPYAKSAQTTAAKRLSAARLGHRSPLYASCRARAYRGASGVAPPRKRHYCPVCGYGFTRTTTRRRHIITQHGDFYAAQSKVPDDR